MAVGFFGNAMANGKPQAGAGCFGGKIWREYFLPHLFGYAGAVISNSYNNIASLDGLTNRYMYLR